MYCQSNVTDLLYRIHTSVYQYVIQCATSCGVMKTSVTTERWLVQLIRALSIFFKISAHSLAKTLTNCVCWAYYEVYHNKLCRRWGWAFFAVIQMNPSVSPRIRFNPYRLHHFVDYESARITTSFFLRHQLTFFSFWCFF